MKKNKYSLTIFILFLAFQSAAQNGPQVPCLDCEKYSQRTLPKEGLNIALNSLAYLYRGFTS